MSTLRSHSSVLYMWIKVLPIHLSSTGFIVFVPSRHLHQSTYRPYLHPIHSTTFSPRNQPSIPTRTHKIPHRTCLNPHISIPFLAQRPYHKKQKQNETDTCRVRTCASEENRCLKDLSPRDRRKSFKSIALTTRPKCPTSHKLSYFTKSKFIIPSTADLICIMT